MFLVEVVLSFIDVSSPNDEEWQHIFVCWERHDTLFSPIRRNREI